MQSFPEYPVIAAPFGIDDSDIEYPKTPGDFIPLYMAAPASNGGVGLSWHYMNGVGYLATLGSFLDRVGYPYGFNPPASGYPKGAIVSIFDGVQLKEFISLKDDNTDSPLSFNYDLDEPDKSRQDLYFSAPSWRPLYRLSEYNFFPDYFNPTTVYDKEVKYSQFGNTLSIPEIDGWVKLQFTWSYEDGTTIRTEDLRHCYLEICCGTVTSESFLLERVYMEAEGDPGVRFMPWSDNLTLRISGSRTNVAKLTITKFPLLDTKEATS